MTYSIRFAGPDDAHTIHVFIVALATYAREPGAVHVTPGILRAQLGAPQPPFGCLLAERDGAPVGFALFFQSYSTWRGRAGIYLEDLYVQETHRGAGIGTALLRRLAEIAIERGCARLEWSALEWNTSAIAFYERIGAVAQRGSIVFRLADEALERLAPAGTKG
jgi:GNAT superfamily N-acetyltransferase